MKPIDSDDLEVNHAANEWDRAAALWDARMGENGDWFQEFVVRPAIFGLLGSPRGLRILDAGCGNGHLSRALARAGAMVTAVDVSTRLLERARGYARGEHLQITYIHDDLSQPNCAERYPSRFDAIVCNLVIQDVENYIDLVRNLRELVERPGRVVISTRHPCFTATRKELGWQLVVQGSTSISSGPGLTHVGRLSRFEGEFFKMDRYFEEGRIERQWGEGVTTVSFHRTIQSYVSAFAGAGFGIETIVEPRPEERGILIAPSMAKLLRRLPHFIVFMLRVPADA